VSQVWRANVIILSPRDTLMQLGELVTYLDAYLRVGAVPDAPHALNGLQVTKTGDVGRLAAAVDLCEATVRLAADQRSDVLLVHHGLFWGGPKPLTGPAYRRVAGLVQHNIALYSAHLPLDLHPEVGNNAVLARRLGVTVRGGFGAWSTACRSASGESWTRRARHCSNSSPWRSALRRVSWPSARSGCAVWGSSPGGRAR